MCGQLCGKSVDLTDTGAQNRWNALWKVQNPAVQIVDITGLSAKSQFRSNFSSKITFV